MTHRFPTAAFAFVLALPACSDSGSEAHSPAGDGGPSAVDLDFTKFDAAVEAFLTEHGLKGASGVVARRPDAPQWFLDDPIDLTPRLSGVSAPTLLVFGGHDAVAPVAAGEHLRARLPDARLEVVPEATHDLEEEFPDLLASLIEAHLRG